MKFRRYPQRDKDKHVNDRGCYAIDQLFPGFLRATDRRDEQLHFARREDVAFDQIFGQNECVFKIYGRQRSNRNCDAFVEHARLRGDVADFRRNVRQNLRVARHHDSRRNRIQRQSGRNLCFLFERSRRHCAGNEGALVQRGRAPLGHQ